MNATKPSTEGILLAPAKVGSRRFFPGVKVAAVIEAAQAQYLIDHTPPTTLRVGTGSHSAQAATIEDIHRAEFETFWEWKIRGIARHRPNEFERLQDGTYAHDEVQRDYWVWTCARNPVMLEQLYKKDCEQHHG